MSKMDADEAEQTLAFIKELGQLFDDELDQFRESTAN
jgi:hypothetical protein